MQERRNSIADALELRLSCTNPLIYAQIAKFMGPTWGPPGSCRPQVGPMLAPWTLLSGCLFNFVSAGPPRTGPPREFTGETRPPRQPQPPKVPGQTSPPRREQFTGETEPPRVDTAINKEDDGITKPPRRPRVTLPPGFSGKPEGWTGAPKPPRTGAPRPERTKAPGVTRPEGWTMRPKPEGTGAPPRMTRAPKPQGTEQPGVTQPTRPKPVKDVVPDLTNGYAVQEALLDSGVQTRSKRSAVGPSKHPKNPGRFPALGHPRDKRDALMRRRRILSSGLHMLDKRHALASHEAFLKNKNDQPSMAHMRVRRSIDDSELARRCAEEFGDKKIMLVIEDNPDVKRYDGKS